MPDQWRKGTRHAFRAFRNRPESARKFFYFSRGNPLKSPDSEKLLKTNESKFTSVYAVLLGFACINLCIMCMLCSPTFSGAFSA
jgi:hypothetical protein